ncbi:peroxiredoxin-like family protein [Paraburkholderia silvatlantica]|nr:peroxiredoxin-like family protein [Paraburkholderia silvatlantica]
MKQDRSISKSDADTLAAMAAASAAMSGILRAGARVPPFTLPDRQGSKVSLDHLLMAGPVVLDFVRGAWCAYGEESLAQFASAYDRITTLGAKAVAIAPHGRPAHAGDALPMPELIDMDMKVARAFGLAFDLPAELRTRYLALGYTPPRTQIAGSFLVPIPATYLIDPDGLVVLAYVSVDYRTRFDSESLITALQALTVRRKTGERAARQLVMGRRRARHAV